MNNNVKKQGVNYRSTSNLGIKNFTSNITLERNGSEPNLFLSGIRQKDKTTQLRFAYDKYLSSVAAKYALQKIEKNLTLNINNQKEVFKEEFDILKQQLVTLSEELKLKNKLKMEKQTIDTKCEILELLNKSIIFDDSDEEVMSLFTTTAYKVVVKNFKKMDENELNAVKHLLSEIIEQLKQIDYENKIQARIQLKDLLIKIAMLIKELDICKIKCEELFDKQESMQSYNTSLNILKDQYGENSNSTIPKNNSNLMVDIEKVFNEIE